MIVFVPMTCQWKEHINCYTCLTDLQMTHPITLRYCADTDVLSFVQYYLGAIYCLLELKECKLSKGGRYKLLCFHGKVLKDDLTKDRSNRVYIPYNWLV